MPEYLKVLHKPSFANCQQSRAIWAKYQEKEGQGWKKKKEKGKNTPPKSTHTKISLDQNTQADGVHIKLLGNLKMSLPQTNPKQKCTHKTEDGNALWVSACQQPREAGELVESAEQLVKRQHSLLLFFFSKMPQLQNRNSIKCSSFTDHLLVQHSQTLTVECNSFRKRSIYFLFDLIYMITIVPTEKSTLFVGKALGLLTKSIQMFFSV